MIVRVIAVAALSTLLGCEPPELPLGAIDVSKPEPEAPPPPQKSNPNLNNPAPVAQLLVPAGTTNPASAVENTMFGLDASPSSDPEGETLTFQWDQITGPAAAITSPAMAVTNVTAPDVDGPQVLEFQVVVSDGVGQTDSIAHTMTVVDTCDESGTPRAVNGPLAGGVLVSEIFADPDGPDFSEEWFELAVLSSTPVDLNGLVLENEAGGSVRSTTLTATSCITVQPSSFVVVGTTTSLALNGNVQVDQTVDVLLLHNEASTFRLLMAGALVDEGELPAPTRGVSTSLDPMNLSAAGNDLPAAWCPATTSGEFDGLGTPGLPNDSC